MIHPDAVPRDMGQCGGNQTYKIAASNQMKII